MRTPFNKTGRTRSRRPDLPFRAGLLSLPLLLSMGVIGEAQAAKVAFIGDQGIGDRAKDVLRLIKDENVDLVLIQGDLGYEDDGERAAAYAAAQQWERDLNDVLGSDFPVLSVAGNHEKDAWPAYRQYITERVDRVGSLSCDGNVGIQARCEFDNLEIVQVAPGIYDFEPTAGISRQDFADYITNEFSAPTDKWRICSWHMNQTAMQTGTKGDDAGWEVFDSCLKVGALVAMAHEHAYSRTYLLDNFELQSVVSRSNDMTLAPNRSFAFVSGLGGREARNQERGGDHFASIHTRDQGATGGALFCDFGGDRAECRFEDLSGAQPDSFTLRRGYGSEAVPEVTDSRDTDYVFSRTDKEELRWIGATANGEIGNVWIDESCATRLGGVSVTGDWGDLLNAAPAVDAIANPCVDTPVEQYPDDQPATLPTGGFVFSRTDKNEHWWIARGVDGQNVRTWIDADCVERNGGATRTGDWEDLTERAPEVDTGNSPCA